ncbi:MAG: radical SAM family heme chaperone HemW [Clostridia bacterium]|nr:radical SAM family heme chaperone HemW [Clostridia bacterium]
MRGLYVHVPFCLKKCDYCDFVSYPDCYHLEEAYVDALLSEFQQYRGEAVDTVYLGGGTPTSLQTKSLVRILNGAFETFDVAKDAEVTVECNPKTADGEKLSALLETGANRLSIGVQSLDDTVLSAIGRIHTAEDAAECISLAKQAGFINISGDVMFGLPGQSMESLEDTLRKMTKLPLTHISCYGLICEEETPLTKRIASGELTLPDEDTEYNMYRTVVSLLKEAGFHQYEISNFAKPGMESRHNQKYWDCIEYFGCGAAAHSYFEGERYHNTEDLTAYLKNPGEKLDIMDIGLEDAVYEYMMLGLRKTEGASKSWFSERFGMEMKDCFRDVIEKYKKNGLLQENGDFISFTEQGIYVSNTVLCEFM